MEMVFGNNHRKERLHPKIKDPHLRDLDREMSEKRRVGNDKEHTFQFQTRSTSSTLEISGVGIPAHIYDDLVGSSFDGPSTEGLFFWMIEIRLIISLQWLCTEIATILLVND